MRSIFQTSSVNTVPIRSRIKRQKLSGLMQRGTRNILTFPQSTTNIYKQFKDKYSRAEITLMIRSALKDIRFNNQRGYFFVYDKKATNIIHPLVPKLEGKNLINHQDSKGVYVLKDIKDAHTIMNSKTKKNPIKSGTGEK